MALYTDGIHLIADRIPELHEFAQKIGIEKKWFVDHRHEHYPLIGTDPLEKAIAAGAKVISSREIVQLGINKWKFRNWINGTGLLEYSLEKVYPFVAVIHTPKFKLKADLSDPQQYLLGETRINKI